jgi:N-glycosylase/DNA lyase
MYGLVDVKTSYTAHRKTHVTLNTYYIIRRRGNFYWTNFYSYFLMRVFSVKLSHLIRKYKTFNLLNSY